MKHALLAASALTLLSTMQPADACGSYVEEPTLLRISEHYGDRGERAFAITGETVAREQAWVRLAPSTYDYASVVDVADPAKPMDLTLLGPKGTRVVASKQRVYLADTFAMLAPSVAYELRVQRGDFVIAMAGKHASAIWTPLTGERGASAADLAWLRAQSVTPLDARYVYVHQLGELETLTVLPASGPVVTLVRRGSELQARFEGDTLGGFTLRGRQYVVAAKHGEAPTAIWL